jgi:hypothetical protein
MANTATKSTTGRRRGIILTGLLATGLAAGILAPSMASAGTVSSVDSMRKGAAAGDGAVNSTGFNTSAFRVNNMSPFLLRQVSVTTDYEWEDGGTPPSDGATINPAERVHYEAKTAPANRASNTSLISYEAVDADGEVVGTATGHLVVNTFGGHARMSCESVTGAVTCDTNGWDDITVTAKDPATITVGSDQAATQARLMRELCGHDGVSCNFSHAGRSTDAYALPRVVGKVFYNDRNSDANFKLEQTDEVTQTDTVGVEIKAADPVFHVFDVALKYEHGWESKNGTTMGFDVEVKPGGSAWLEATSAVQRFTGTFTIKMGNTTWELDNAFVDSFDGSRTSGWHLCGSDPQGGESKNLTAGDRYVCKVNP